SHVGGRKRSGCGWKRAPYQTVPSPRQGRGDAVRWYESTVVNRLSALSFLLVACGGGSVAPLAPPTVPATPEISPVACISDAADPGRAVVRPLSRREYDNTVRDLLGDATAPARFFSPEADGIGFDT